MGKIRWDRFALPLLAAAVLTAQTGATVFQGATVVNGTGKALVAQNVRVVGDRIHRVGSF